MTSFGTGVVDRIALGFLALRSRDFNFQIFRRELLATASPERGTRFLPRDLTNRPSDGRNGISERVRYQVSLQPVPESEAVTVGAWVDPGLTVHVLREALLEKCRSSELAGSVEIPDKQFIRKVAFVLRRHAHGVREVVWVGPYELKSQGRFGFLLDFALSVPRDSTIPHKLRMELSLSLKNGRPNEDFYLDRYAKINQFLTEFYAAIERLELHDRTTIELESKLSVLRSFKLSKRVFLFGQNKEGKSQFFGLKNLSPFQTVETDVRIVFMFQPGDRAKSQDLYRALRGDTYSTFPGMQQMFKVPFGRENVTGLEVGSFGNEELQKACKTLRSEYPLQTVVPVVVAPMSKHSSEDETRAYFAAKHAFLSQGFPSQFVDRKRLEDRTSMRWSISNIGLGLFAKMGGVPWRLKPSTEKCLIVGIGQAHTVVNERIERYFAYSVLTDSSGVYERIKLLGNSTDPDEYHESLKNNLREVLLSHKNQHSSFVLHLTFRMKKAEIETIKNLVAELSQGEGAGQEFIVLKFNDINDFFGFSVDHNSYIPYEGTITPLSRNNFLMWFSGLSLEESKVPRRPERPVLVSVLYPHSTLSEMEIERVLQDSMNIAGANWRGFNAKSMPISVYYAKLIADYFAHFRTANLAEVDIENISPWFL
jgi:hypothetical protein